MNGRFSTDKLLGQVDVHAVSQVAYGSGRVLQGFPDALGPCIQLSVQRPTTGGGHRSGSRVHIAYPSSPLPDS